jgi:UDP-glucose 4-epimerase
MAVYLVTGIAGFIGSSLARTLLARGEQVRGIDNFCTGKRENLADMLDRIVFIEGDVGDPTASAEACRGADYVFHEAALASVPRSVEDPVSTNQNNVTATLQLLLAARDAGVKRVVYAGSSSAYGETPELPKREDMTPSPISPYAVSKLAGEQYMASFYRVYGLQTVTLRYFNVFGPWQAADSQYSGVLAKFITSMLRGEQPTIFGDGEQSRDFTYIDNVVRGNLLACSADASVCGDVFNVATNSRITLNETFEVLKRIIGYPGDVAYAAERTGDIKHSFADISKAKRGLGYEPLVGFEEGLRHTVDWYRTQMKPAVAAIS